MPYWDRKGLEGVVTAHCQGLMSYTAEINAVLSLAAIERTLLQDVVATAREEGKAMLRVS